HLRSAAQCTGADPGRHFRRPADPRYCGRGDRGDGPPGDAGGAMTARRVGVQLGLLLMALSAGCSSPPADQAHSFRFAFIPKALHIPVFDYARTGAERAAKQLGDIEILWRGPESTDEIRQKEILESFIAQRVDGIAISCLNGDLLTDAIDR